MSNERWVVSLHEAGHAVIGLSFGCRCDGILLTNDGGLALCQELVGDQRAQMLCAGRFAESLAADYQEPNVAYQPIEEIAKQPVQGEILYQSYCAVAGVDEIPSSLAGSDDQQLALWAITGYEDQPERWTERLFNAKFHAERRVALYADEIVKVARELYQRGRLSGDEIKEILGV